MAKKANPDPEPEPDPVAAVAPDPEPPQDWRGQKTPEWLRWKARTAGGEWVARAEKYAQ